MSQDTEMVAEHYQKTYELTLQMWEQRNRTFMLLLGVVGAATLLTFDVAQAGPLLVDIIATIVGITDPARINELQRGFPYGLVQSVFLMVILYLMVVLYHRTAFILRSYRYIAALEPEIKSSLGLPEEAVAFTRESAFYQKYRSPFARFVAMTYIGMLGLLLVAFLSARIYTDFSSGNAVVGVIDVAIATPTLFLFIAYANSS